MSLNYDLTNVDDSVCWTNINPETGKAAEDDARWMNNATHQLIFDTMAIRIGKFTEKNIDEVVFRIRLWEMTTGRVERGFGLTPVMTIKDHIGLSTNVLDESRSAFMKVIANVVQDHIRAEVRANQKVDG